MKKMMKLMKGYNERKKLKKEFKFKIFEIEKSQFFH